MGAKNNTVRLSLQVDSLPGHKIKKKQRMLWIRLMTSIWCHLPEHASTPSNKIDQFCSLADTCIHDTIPICGRMGEETRTFLDLCDLLEFACDTNQVFAHVDDMEGCPVFKF